MPQRRTAGLRPGRGKPRATFEFRSSERSQQQPRGQADAPVKAFRNTSGEVIVLASVDLGSRAFVGPTLGTATHRCGVYFNSTLDYAMSASACREWIQSPYSFPNGSTYALTHMECKRAAPFRFLKLSS